MPIDAPTPEHYHILSVKLGNLCRLIRVAIEWRSEQIFSPWKVKEAVTTVFADIGPAINKFEIEVTKLATDMITPGTRPSPEEVITAVKAVEKPVSELVSLHCTLWSRPFPQLYKEGQILLSGVTAKPLYVILDLFGKMKQILDAPDKAIEEHGSDIFRFKLNFNSDKEVENFLEWYRIYGFIPPT